MNFDRTFLLSITLVLGMKMRTEAHFAEQSPLLIILPHGQHSLLCLAKRSPQGMKWHPVVRTWGEVGRLI